MNIQLEEIKILAEAVNNLADAIRGAKGHMEVHIPAGGQPAMGTEVSRETAVSPTVQPAQTDQAVQPAVPISTVTYSMDDLARAAMTLMDAGRQAELQQILSAFNVMSLPELSQEQYGAFATALREKGAQI